MNYNDLPDGWFNDQDSYTYSMLVATLPENSIIVELGVWMGRSICSLSDLIKAKNLQVHLVDTFMGSDGEVAHEEVVKQVSIEDILKSNLLKFGIDSHSTIHKGTTKDIASNFDNAYFDFIFVDADHTFEGALSDIELWYPKLKYSGTMAGHDWLWGVNEPVTKYAKEHDLKINALGSIWWFV